MFNAGFCTYMGASTCMFDFVIGGPEFEKQYWITSIMVSLWASEDNPRDILLQATLRPELHYTDVVKHRVQRKSDSQARIEVNKPLQYVRLHFRNNFGGTYGIALRKITFYGYDIRPVSIIA